MTEIKVLKHNKLLNKEKPVSKRKFLLLYTAAFSFIAFILFYDFFSNGYSLVRSGDAFFQHYKALMYLAKYIREIITNILFEHRFIIPQWDFEVGLGSDIISTFAYYSFGDPFNYLSFLVPTRYMHIYFQAMILLRLYCAGLSFSYLCFKTEKRNIPAVLAGSITYCFSAWAVYSGLKHPYFINPMVFLPLIVLSVEKILKGKSFLGLTFMVALSTISNFYFFYIIVLLTVIYVAVRFISVYKLNIKSMLSPLIKITGGSVLGVCMGAVLFLPVVLAFLGDTRADAGYDISLFYPLKTYIDMPVSFLTFTLPSSWLYTCVSILFIPCVAVMFTEKRKNSHIKALLIISIIMMSFPIFGKIFNGFSYPCNRWCFGYILVAAYIVTTYWEKLINAEKKHIIAITAGAVLITAMSLLIKPKAAPQLTIPVILFVATIILLIFNCIKKSKASRIAVQIFLLCFTFISIISYSYYKISPEKGDYVSEFTKQGFFENRIYKSDLPVSEASKSDKTPFWRYSGRNISQNSAFLSNLKPTQYYYSLSNGNISNFRLDMNLPEYSPYCYTGFDSRTVLNSLSSVKYFYNGDKSNKAVPYGYKKTETPRVYINQYALPFGYTYDEYITKEEFDSITTSVDKEWTMLNAAVLENKTTAISHSTPETSSTELDYKTKCVNKNVTQDGNKFIVTKKNAKVNFYFQPVKNSETIVSLVNMTYQGINPYDLYSDNTEVDPLNLYSFEQLNEKKKERIVNDKKTWQESSRVYTEFIGYTDNGKQYSNELCFYTKSNSFYLGRGDFDLNLGYTRSGMKKVTVVFKERGIYTFDDIKIIAQPMDGYEEKISDITKDTLQNLLIDYNIITGSISLTENKLLCLSMPYADGWTAYVDGEKSELLKVNGMYCGLMLEKGEHRIELRYQTPGLKIGAVISFVSVVLFVYLLLKEFKNNGSFRFCKKRKNGV